MSLCVEVAQFVPPGSQSTAAWVDTVGTGAQYGLRPALSQVMANCQLVLLDASEYNTVIMQSVWDIPDGTTLAAIFALGMTIPLAAGLVAKVCGSILELLKH
ncbi:MAG: hypothetical protein H6R10_608 [Rhodocyclaceae bacterium]|nr:hypothetical protein [Rhodocyclaceae bacterium]